MRRPSTAVAVASAAVLAAVAAPALAAGGHTRAHRSARTAATPACSTSNLVVWLDTNGNGAAGSVVYNVEFTNLGGSSCTLTGFPGVSAVGLRGHQVGSAASREKSFKAKTITLKTNRSAIAQVKITDAGNFPQLTCKQTMAAGLKVFPPNQTRSRTVPFPFLACGRKGTVYLDVKPVQKQP